MDVNTIVVDLRFKHLRLTFLLVALAFSVKGADTMARPKARVLLLAVLMLGGQEYCRTAQAQSNVEHFPPPSPFT
jgi:hypothetical protein